MLEDILQDSVSIDKLSIDKLIEDLADILEEEKLFFTNFFETSKDKTNIIVNGNITELEELVKTEQAFETEMQALETKREKIVLAIGKKLGMDSSETTITSIIEWITPKTNNKGTIGRLTNCRDSINSLVGEIKEVNELNAKLINQSLEYINFSIHLLTSIENTGAKYGNDGKESKTERRSVFDIKL